MTIQIKGGARISTGADSKQDYQTPADFKAAVEGRFGRILFDLAAHAENALCPDYYAPRYFFENLRLPSVEFKGNTKLLDMEALGWLCKKHDRKKGEYHLVRRTPNDDPKAFRLDALAQDWHADLSGLDGKFGATLRDGNGICWLNCEFDDCATWAEKCVAEGKLGLPIALLTPASVGADWAKKFIWPHADVYMLNGRISFDGKDPYPKDCMLSIFGGKTTRRLRVVWDWRNNVIF